MFYSKKFVGSLCLIAVLYGVVSLPAVGQTNAPASVDTSWARHIYDTDAIFNLLSSGGQRRLESLYGSKKTSSLNSVSSKKSSISPFITDSPLSPITNTLVNDPSQDSAAFTQNETALCFYAGGVYIIAAYNDSGSYVSSTGKSFIGWSYTANTGASFTDSGPFFTGSGNYGDPVLANNSTFGYFYMSSLAQTQQNVNVSIYFGGVTTLNAAPGFSGTDFQDKPWMTIDNFASTGQNYLYCVFRDFGSGAGKNAIFFTRSTDIGYTWGPSTGYTIASALSNNVQGPFVTVAPDHSVDVFWLDQSGGVGATQTIKMRQSTDLGVSFGNPVTVATLNNVTSNGDLGLGFRTNTFPQAAVNPTNANYLYAVYNDNNSGDKGDIYLVKSSNGGASWSSPVKVNDDGSTTAQWMPAISVRPDGKGLCITWYDRRRDGVNIDRYGVIVNIASNNVLTIGRNFRITTQSFPAANGNDAVVNSVYMGDYDMMLADSNFYYTSWGDNRNLGNYTSLHQADVRFAKIPVGGVGLEFSSASVAGGNGNGVIEHNECSDIFVTLQNNGVDTATGLFVTLTLASSANYVTISQSTSKYSNLTVGQLGTNLAAFHLNLTSSYPMGNPLYFLATVTSATYGTLSFPFRLNTGLPGASTTYSSNSVVEIPDNNSNGIYIPITVSGFNSTLGHVEVGCYITHTFDGDLKISLISPEGSTTLLSNRRGGGGDNFGTTCNNPTIFDDTAATAISSGVAPFIGMFIPDEPLSGYNGKFGGAVNGTWLLHIADLASQDTGTTYCWFLTLSAVSTSSGPGECTDLWPVTNFLYSPSEGFGPISVNFADTSKYSPTAWSWNFGDGNSASIQNPTHQYLGVGKDTTYSIRLIASNIYGAGTVSSSYHLGALTFVSDSVNGVNSSKGIVNSECANVYVTIFNTCSVTTASGISGTLSLASAIPGVQVVQGLSPYSDLIGQQYGTNLTPFVLNIDSSANLAPIIYCYLTVTCNNVTPFTITVPLVTGTPSAPTTFSSSSSVVIADLSDSSSQINITGITGTINKAVVQVFLNHTFDGDLILSLVSPDSTEAILSYRHGSGGNDYGTACDTVTIFDDNGVVPLITGSDPFVGTFAPDSSLSIFAGKSGAQVNGLWTFRARDVAGFDSGTTICWSLTLYTADTTPGLGSCLQPTITTLPTLKLYKGQSLSTAFDLNDYNSSTVASSYTIPIDFLALSSLNGSTVNQASYGSATSGVNTFQASNIFGTITSLNKVKYSTYKIRRIPPVILRPNTSITVNMKTYTFTSSGSALAPSYGNSSSLASSNLAQVTAFWSNNSTLTIFARPLFNTAQKVNVIAATVPGYYGSDIDREEILVYPSLSTTLFEFSNASDTVAFSYQIPAGASTLPGISQVASINDTAGVASHGGALKVNISASTNGVKITPKFAHWLANTPGQWYTLRVRVFGTNTVNNYLQVFFNGNPGQSPTDIQGYFKYTMPNTWTNFDIPLNSNSAVSSAPVMYPQIVIKANGAGSGTAYIDEIEIIQAAPHLIDSPRYLTSDHYDGGTWDDPNALTKWASQTLAGSPFISVSNGQLVVNTVDSTQSGVKFTASTAVGTVYTVKANAGQQVGMHMQTKLQSGNQDLSQTQVQMNLLGAAAKGSFTQTNDIGAVAEVGRISNRTMRSSFTAVGSYYQVQFIIKNKGTSTIYIDNTLADVDNDDPNYGDVSLYP